MNTFKHTISDIWIMVHRNGLHFFRMPQLIVFSTIQPVMFLLLFTYVFGGAIKTPGIHYIQYLLPGILVQTIVFGAMMTGIGLAGDLAGGMIDRFRSLPMARSAVLAGRTIADIGRNIFVVLLMTGVGYLIGFRIEHGIGNFILAVLGALAFGFAFSWISATIGVSVKDVETAQSAGMIWVFPLVFASSIFVPVESMPGWLQSFAKHSPITVTVNTVRALVNGLPVGANVWQMLAWIVGILLVFMPLAVWRYRTASS
jgi:ABC-2 type transport system permease protein/oleandomycin transport system permease protein